ncbi:MAG: molybdopterin-guanine dinucleotide biosynthesis protein B [Planctomycetota bacterium]
MPKIVSIVGNPYSGKTTLLEKIVKELVKRGYQIGTIKHNVHGFEIDYPGKDSYRHFHSGSKMAMILGTDKIAVVRRLEKSLSLRQAIQMFFNNREHKLDLIITEGFKRESKPKIEIVRSKISSEPICRVKEDNLVALISDIKITNYNIPQFRLNDISKITDFIEDKFICQKKIKKTVRTDSRSGVQD